MNDWNLDAPADAAAPDILVYDMYGMCRIPGERRRESLVSINCLGLLLDFTDVTLHGEVTRPCDVNRV